VQNRNLLNFKLDWLLNDVPEKVGRTRQGNRSGAGLAVCSLRSVSLATEDLQAYPVLY